MGRWHGQALSGLPGALSSRPCSASGKPVANDFPCFCRELNPTMKVLIPVVERVLPISGGGSPHISNQAKALAAKNA